MEIFFEANLYMWFSYIQSNFFLKNIDIQSFKILTKLMSKQYVFVTGDSTNFGGIKNLYVTKSKCHTELQD